jgi:hypothetical protein
VKSGKHLIEEAAKGIPHLLAPILPEASIMLVAGHSGTLKTWHVLNLVVDLALGKTWLNHPKLSLGTGPVNCLYVNKEMSGTILGNRLALLMKHDRYASDPATPDALANRIFTADEAILDLRSDLQRADSKRRSSKTMSESWFSTRSRCVGPGTRTQTPRSGLFIRIFVA